MPTDYEFGVAKCGIKSLGNSQQWQEEIATFSWALVWESGGVSSESGLSAFATGRACAWLINATASWERLITGRAETIAKGM